MEKQLVWISPWRTMAVVAPAAFLLSYPLIGVIWVINQFASAPGRPTWMAFVLLPIAFCVVVTMLSGLAAWIYNMLSAFGLRLHVRTQGFPDDSTDAQPLDPANPPPGDYYRF